MQAYKLGVTFNGRMLMPNFAKINHLVRKLKEGTRARTHTHTHRGSVAI